MGSTGTPATSSQDPNPGAIQTVPRGSSSAALADLSGAHRDIDTSSIPSRATSLPAWTLPLTLLRCQLAGVHYQCLNLKQRRRFLCLSCRWCLSRSQFFSGTCRPSNKVHQVSSCELRGECFRLCSSASQSPLLLLARSLQHVGYLRSPVCYQSLQGMCSSIAFAHSKVIPP